MWQQIIKTLCLFSIGLGLAVALVNRDKIVASVSSLETNANIPAVITAQPQMSTQQLRLDTLIVELETAIAEGSALSLQKIRPEVLKQYQPHDKVILAAVRKQLLISLLDKFNKQDWEQGVPIIQTTTFTPRTPAVQFVNDILLINTELGVYLEAAATLFSKLYLATQRGLEFDLTSYLQGIPTNLEVEYRLSNPSFSFRNFAQDLVFIEIFEQVRHRLFVLYASTYPGRVENILRLVKPLKAELFSIEETGVFRNLLFTLASRVTPRYRLALLSDTAQVDVLEKFISPNSDLHHVYAELLNVTAMDAIEVKNLTLAEVFYHRSLEFAQGLESQALLRNALSDKFTIAEQARAAEHAPDSQATSVPLFSNLARPETVPSDAEGGFTLGVIAIVFLVIGTLVMIIFSRYAVETRYNEAVREVTNAPLPNQAEFPPRAEGH